MLCFAAALVLGALFVMRERATDEPAVPLELFTSRQFVAGNVLVLVGSGLMFPVWCRSRRSASSPHRWAGC